MKSRRRHSLTAILIGFFWACFFRLQCASWRKHYEGMDVVDQRGAEGRKMMLCFWHGKYVPIFSFFRWLWIAKRKQTACVFTSQSARGDIIAEICRFSGLDCQQIPDQGRRHSFELMRRALTSRQNGVIAVDGPLGPRHRVKPGAVRLASELGFLLVPASISATRKHVVRSRWDRMEFPRFFARVGCAIGKPMEVPANLSPRQMRATVARLQRVLESLDQRAEELVEGRQPRRNPSSKCSESADSRW